MGDAENATQVLRGEHGIIERAILAFSGIIQQMEAGTRLDRGRVWEMCQAFKSYVERCHHAKEDFLLAMVRTRGGFTSDFPLQSFYEEHQHIQLLLSNLARSGHEYVRVSHGTPERMVQALRALIDFYPGHMWKADHLLFPLADRLFSEADQQVLLQQFAWIDSAAGSDDREELESIAGEFGPPAGHAA